MPKETCAADGPPWQQPPQLHDGMLPGEPLHSLPSCLADWWVVACWILGAAGPPKVVLAEAAGGEHDGELEVAASDWKTH